MTCGEFVVSLPPVGIVQRHVEGFVEWAPGNGIAYRLFVHMIPARMRGVLGGSVIISVQNRDGVCYTSYVCNPGGVFSINFIEEKFGEKRDSLYYVTALINWAIYGVESTGGSYAQELFDEAQKRWV